MWACLNANVTAANSTSSMSQLRCFSKSAFVRAREPAGVRCPATSRPEPDAHLCGGGRMSSTSMNLWVVLPGGAGRAPLRRGHETAIHILEGPVGTKETSLPQ